MDNGNEMLNIPIAAGSRFGGLHQAVNALQHGIGAVTPGMLEDPAQWALMVLAA